MWNYHSNTADRLPICTPSRNNTPVHSSVGLLNRTAVAMSSDDDDDDEYIIHGQLLDSIQEDEIVKRKDAEQQFVRDENGRKRFHGAFTGGFSAGFFNTVGSQEGWTPTSFKSSRNLKSTLKPQNAYDFMDEEDKKDLGIDSSSLKIKAEYSGQSSRKRQCPEINTGPIPGKPVLGEILKPTTDTWGVELLKSMGWKPGQGIGPHLTQREKLRTKKELENVGMKFKTNTKYDDNDFEINELLDNFKVSPYEYESIAIKPKTDVFGLGYESIKSSNVPIKSTEKVYSKLTVGGKSIHGQAFGVGAYEDDDEDIYSTDNMSNYDFSLDVKNQNSKKISKYNTVDSECIDGFVKDNVKHEIFEELPSSINIPYEWRPQGMFERILGRSAPDLFIKPIGQFNVNVNSRQRTMKKFEQPPLVKETIKKEVHSLLPDILLDRFTKAVLPDESTNALIPVVRTSDPELQKLKDYANQKFFGFWTRKTESWIPDKLLCKRFNVPVPKQAIVNYTNDGRKKGECSLFSSLEFTSQEPKSVEHQTLNTISLVNDNVNTENNEKQDNSKYVKDVTAEYIIENQKPSVDFFKDIFLDSSDDEMPEVKQSLKNEDIPRNSNQKDVCSTEIPSVKKETVESNVQSAKPFNLFPPKGIFANLNFDELFNSPDNNTTNKNKISSKNETDNSNKQYGPLLPEQNNIQLTSINLKNIKSDSSDDEWVEKTDLSTKKETSHKKKHSKNKKSKHKKKSKKKSHKHK